MSVRALAAVAAILLLLAVTAGVLLVRRLGWLETGAQVEWTFTNPTLLAARGQRVILRPIVEGVLPLRYTFLLTVADPRPDDDMAPVPHLRAGTEELEDGEWAFRQPEALALCQMGALTAQEWLAEIRPVVERWGSGEERLLLKAIFGHRSGATVTYYHDPAAPVPAMGWTRSELVGEGRPPEVHFATDAGIAAVPD
ncbi:MAG: hypothetical protein L6Q95_03860 [Planctomycetes bacterium]|nr:hypothetical protein [Planctomycetota bacterium]